jgi:hypothetical protein
VNYLDARTSASIFRQRSISDHYMAQFLTSTGEMIEHDVAQRGSSSVTG